MAKQSISQLRQWFQTDDYPTQQQFYDWMDSYFHKDEMVPMSGVSGLVLQLQTINDILNHLNPGGGGMPPVTLINTNVWTAPAGTLIEKIVVINEAPITISCGLTDGNKDLLADQDCDSGYTIIQGWDRYFTAQSTIHFNGITGDTVIKLYTR